MLAATVSIALLSIPHRSNWVFGWASLLGAFITGGLIGLRFHQDDFWGGYDSFRRRIVRLGHIAQAALGIINVVYALSPLPMPGTWQASMADIAFMIGGVAMPLVCFLSGWRRPFRHLFFIPVVSLVLAVVFTLWGGVS